MTDYTNQLEQAIFLVMEIGKQQYSDIMKMPVKRFRNYIKWKNKFDEEVSKRTQQEIDGS